nr:aminotransferase class V-fold PLP-dependent enzyme [Streptomyces sp. 846.5]
MTRAAGVPFLLDATQSVGQFPVDVAELGCDMLSATGRKFLRGPRGTGFLWVRPEALGYLEPHVVEIAAATWDGKRGFDWHHGARRFETWELSYANVLGLSAAVQQALDLGTDEIGRRALARGARLRDRLDAVPGITTHDLGAQRCAIVTCKVDGMATAQVAAALAAQGINVSTTDPVQNQFDTEDRDVHPLVRLSPHYYNTEAEIDRAVEVLIAVAEAAWV